MMDNTALELKRKKILTSLLATISELSANQDTVDELFAFLIRYTFLLEQSSNNKNSCFQNIPQLNATQGNIYMGARYLDPKYSRWISVDPALGEYIPRAPINNEAKKHNQNLPEMGGLFNSVNGNLYHYAGNNPVKYVDPDGNKIFDARWWKRNKDEIIGFTFDTLEFLTGIAGLKVTFGLSSSMIAHSSASACWKLLKVTVTTIIAEVDGDENADYVDNIFPSSAIGATMYGIAYLVTKLDDTNFRDDQFKKMAGRIGDVLDMALGIGLAKGMDKEISSLLSNNPSMLTKLQQVLKFNKENLIAIIGEGAYQWFSDFVLTDETVNTMVDFYTY